MTLKMCKKLTAECCTLYIFLVHRTRYYTNIGRAEIDRYAATNRMTQDNRVKRIAVSLRNTFMSYFTNERKFEWQEDKIK